MQLSELRPAKGSKKNSKRRGCGPGSGHGKTSCRGHKGQKARSGAKRKLGHEGGQMPLIRRLPKRGFRHWKRHPVQIVNLADLGSLETGSEITPVKLYELGLAKQGHGKIKILAEGEVPKGIVVKAHLFSSQARKKLEDSGGRAEVITVA